MNAVDKLLRTFEASAAGVKANAEQLGNRLASSLPGNVGFALLMTTERHGGGQAFVASNLDRSQAMALMRACRERLAQGDRPVNGIGPT